MSSGVSTDALADLAEKLAAQAISPNLLGYVPHELGVDGGQAAFHRSQARTRLLLGGNRSGKSTGGAVESLWWATDRHPYRRTPKPPVAGRVVVVDFDNGMEKIVLPELKRWAVPADLIGGSWERSWDGRQRILTFANGSTIEFLTTDQDLDKHAGTGRHFVWFDEEPPEPYWNENLARTVSTKGSMWLTMTPLDGQDWTYDRLYLPGTGEEGTSRDPDCSVVRVRIHDNPYLDPAEIERVARAYAASPDDLAARVEGEYVAIGGLIYKGFDSRVHVTEHWLPPADWPFHTSMDHGTVQAAWGWFAVDPQGSIICFHELYRPEQTVPQLAEAVLHFERSVLKRTATTRVGDQSIRNRQQAGGIVVSTQHDYARLGLYIELSTADWETGVNRVRQYLAPGPDGVPRLRFTEDCPVTAKQIARLRYKTYASARLRAASNPPEGQVKRDDHAADMLRYFVSSRPDLAFLGPQAHRGPSVPVMPGATTMAPAAGRVAVLREPSTVDGNTVWQVVSETMGGEW